MPAYIYVNVNIHNYELYEDYKKLTPATVAAYDGRFVVRGGQADVLEGNGSAGRIVILEFPTMERAKEWWNSHEYNKAKAIRQQAATTEMIVMEGFES